MLSGQFSTHHYASKNSCNYKRPSSFRTLYYVLFSPSFIDFMLRVSHSKHLSWKSQCKCTFRRSTGSAGPQRNFETLRAHLSSAWFPSLPRVKPTTLESLESFGVLLSTWKERSVSLEPQPFLTHPPDPVHTVQEARDLISPVTCSAGLI